MTLLWSSLSCGLALSPAIGSRPTRRAALVSAAGLAVTRPLRATAADDDGAWAVHKGAFDPSFFADFQVSKASPDFVYKFLEKGEGDTAVNFQSVTMHYTGYLLDGTKFDSSYGKDPFKFRVGKGKVISGWEGLALGMRPGSKLIARIPPQFAYGDKGVGPIPPGSCKYQRATNHRAPLKGSACTHVLEKHAAPC